MLERVRWGILGTGHIAREFARGLHGIPDAELVAVGSRSVQTAGRFAHSLGIPRAYGSYEELVRDVDVDVVYIATPNSAHRDNCLLALGAGKAVLCEKPFAMNAEEAFEVVTAAREKQVFCMEAMWMRFIPLFQETMARLEDGVIGSVRMLSADFSVPTEFDAKGRLGDPRLGGGSLLDRGIYTLSLAHRLFGPPDEVLAFGVSGETVVDDYCAVTLGYDSGQVAVLTSSLQSYGTNGAVAIGDEGRLEIHEPFYRPQRVTVTKSARYSLSSTPSAAPGLLQRLKTRLKENTWARYLHLRLGRYLGKSTETVRIFDGNGYRYEAEEVMRCLREGRLESEVMSLDESVSIMRTADRIRREWNLPHSEGRLPE